MAAEVNMVNVYGFNSDIVLIPFEVKIMQPNILCGISLTHVRQNETTSKYRKQTLLMWSNFIIIGKLLH